MTSHINLLDWRQARRERRKKDFAVTMGLAFALGVVTVAAAYFYTQGQLEYQQARNSYLRTQITEMNQKIKEIEDLERVKANLLARMRVIEELQASRSASVHFFDEIVNTLPEGVSLTHIQQQGAQVTIEGIAESNGRISTYMKNLDASVWFADPKLIVIKTDERKDQRRQASFQLRVKRLTTPSTEGIDPLEGADEEANPT
ncbi:MAG: PilN domain-containing protein [Nevskiales bacterium]|nr:PilN domain-containing protein [Nevskiales bacterium]